MHYSERDTRSHIFLGSILSLWEASDYLVCLVEAVLLKAYLFNLEGGLHMS